MAFFRRQYVLCWKDVNSQLQVNKNQKYKDIIIDKNSNIFEPQEVDGIDFIKSTGRDIISKDINNNSLITLGANFKKAKYLVWQWNFSKSNKELSEKYLSSLSLEFIDCKLYLFDEIPSDLENMTVDIINDYNVDFLNAEHKTKTMGVWNNDKIAVDFGGLANHSKGVKKLGVLRMDVDDLGEIFINGLTASNEQMGSLSRTSSLSRQLNKFFSSYLNEILKNDEFKNVQIIYSGGDDLFLIGAWNEAIAVASDIKEKFHIFTGKNQSFGISGGVYFIPKKSPILKASTEVGNLESKAKNYTRGNITKNAFSFFDTAIGWEEFSEISRIKDELEVFQIRNGSALNSKLREVLTDVDFIKHTKSSSAVAISQADLQREIYWNKWRWQLVYNIARMQKRYPQDKDFLEKIKDFILDSESNNINLIN